MKTRGCCGYLVLFGACCFWGVSSEGFVPAASTIRYTLSALYWSSALALMGAAALTLGL